MPSLDTYKRLNGGFRTNGDVRKYQSDQIMEYTFDEDLQTKIVYLYDYFHDDEPDVAFDLHPENSKTKIPVEAKYVQNSYHTLDKDAVDFHLQFKPSFNCYEIVPYYYDMFTKIYNSPEVVGLYCDVPDNKGRYQRWLIVDKGFGDALQFDTWSILRCDYQYRWIRDNKKYKMWGVSRSQNS